jgi:hypothetical protein
VESANRFRAANAAVVVVVLVVAGIAAWQLARVMTAAQSINREATDIARAGRGINLATDSVVQLERTNRAARSILASAQPLPPRLGGVIDEAQGIRGVSAAIDGTAGSIDTTAGAIEGSAGKIDTTARAIDGTAGRIDGTAGRVDSTAGAILGTARGINGVAGRINATAGGIRTTAGGIDRNAGGILAVARAIDRDVYLINYFVNGSIDVAALINADAERILDLAIAVHDTAACTDDKLGGPPDGHCRGRPSNGDFGAPDGPDREGTAPLGRPGGPAPMGG